MLRGIHAYISGRVQGVNFRHATHHHAHKYNITGWVKNLADGRVEVQAFGEEDAIQKFQEWLHRGSVLAHVTDVQVTDIPWADSKEFQIIR